MPKNRIEVDLQLMQAEAITKLEKFGKDFNNSLDRLGKLLESSASKFDQTTGGSGVGPVGASASTPQGTSQMMQGVTHARISGVNTGGFGGGGFYNLPPTGGGGNTPGGSDSTAQQTDQSFEDQFIELQKRIGTTESAIPTSFRQALGYYGEGQLQLNPFSPLSPSTINEDFAKIDANPKIKDKAAAKRQAVARRANEVLFNYQSSKALAMNAMGKYGRFWSGIQNVTNSGYQTAPNTGTGGAFGSSLGSGAFWHGLGESIWQPLTTSTFGLNPAYSLGQAQQARQVINQYGWSSGNMGNWLANTLKENTIRYQLNPETQMAFLDPMLRWGGWQSFGQLNAVLGQISSAAQSAGMNLGQFTQELTQVSMQVAQQTGNTPGTVASVLSDFSATTGLAPQQGAELMSTQNIMMSAAFTGKNPWSIYTGKNQSALLALPMTRYQQMIGMPIDRFMKMANGNAAQRKMFGNRMWMMTMMYNQDPSIFGGISPLQMMNILKRNGGVKGWERHMQIQGDITNLHGTGSVLDTHIENLMGRYSPGKEGDAMVARYQQWLSHHEGATAQVRKDMAEQILRRRDHNKQLRASRKIMIELSGDAKKYFQLQGDPGHVNSGGIAGFGRKAMDTIWNDTLGGVIGDNLFG